MNKEQLRESAKKYIEAIYSNHRDQDIESWRLLIDVIMDYVDEVVRHHHPEEL